MTEEKKIKVCTQTLCVYTCLCEEDLAKVPRWLIRSMLRYFDPEQIVTEDPEPITARECCWIGFYSHSDLHRVDQLWNGGDEIKEHCPLLPPDNEAWHALRERLDQSWELRAAAEAICGKIMRKDDDCLLAALYLLVYFAGESTKEELKKQITKKNRELIEDLISYPRD